MTPYWDAFRTVPERFPQRPVTHYVPIAVLQTCWTAGPRIMCSTPAHSMSYHVWSMRCVKISLCHVLVGYYGTTIISFSAEFNVVFASWRGDKLKVGKSHMLIFPHFLTFQVSLLCLCSAACYPSSGIKPDSTLAPNQPSHGLAAMMIMVIAWCQCPAWKKKKGFTTVHHHRLLNETAK